MAPQISCTEHLTCKKRFVISKRTSSQWVIKTTSLLLKILQILWKTVFRINYSLTGAFHKQWKSLYKPIYQQLFKQFSLNPRISSWSSQPHLFLALPFRLRPNRGSFNSTHILFEAGENRMHVGRHVYAEKISFTLQNLLQMAAKTKLCLLYI